MSSSCGHTASQADRSTPAGKDSPPPRAAAAPFAVAPMDETERQERIERLKRLLDRAHRAARWRHGHHGAAAPAGRARLPWRALPQPRARPEGQQRHPDAHAARCHRRHSPRLSRGRLATSSRPTPSTPTRSRRPTTAPRRWCPSSIIVRARLARTTADEYCGCGGTSGLRGGSAGPYQPHVLPLAGRERSRVPQHLVR